MHAIEWCHFRWPWVTPNPGFKDTVVLEGEYLQSDAFYRHSYYTVSQKKTGPLLHFQITPTILVQYQQIFGTKNHQLIGT